MKNDAKREVEGEERKPRDKLLCKMMVKPLAKGNLKHLFPSRCYNSTSL